MKNLFKILSLILILSIVISCGSLFAFADNDYHSTVDNYWEYCAAALADAGRSLTGTSTLGSVFGYLAKGLAGSICGDVCSLSFDGLHHSSYVSPNISRNKDIKGTYVTLACDYCGQAFNAYSDDFSDAYNDYVDTLPVNGIDSDGGLLWYPTIDDCSSAKNGELGSVQLYCANNHVLSWSSPSYTYTVPLLSIEAVSSIIDNRSFSFNMSTPQGTHGFSYRVALNYFCAPVSGYYSIVRSVSFSYSSDSGSGSQYYVADSSSVNVSAGSFFTLSYPAVSPSFDDVFHSLSGVIYLPVFRVVPSDGLTDEQLTMYNINSRTGIITGGLGIIGDNGTIIQTNNNYIFNETENRYYNPTTNTYNTVENWYYDYTTRTYNLTLDTGDTVNVTYGDENITIVEGDTIYNVYYIIDGNGSDPADPSPSPGTGGGDKDDPSPSPSGGGGGVDPSPNPSPGGSGDNTDDGDKSLWEKIGEFLGSLGSGLLALLEAIFGALLDALISLGKLISEKLVLIVEMVLSWFEAIPQMFTGFLAFLASLFSFLPDEIMVLLTFGIAAVVLIGIIKAVRR